MGLRPEPWDKSGKINTAVNEGEASFTPDGNTIFFSRCDVRENESLTCRIYTSTKAVQTLDKKSDKKGSKKGTKKNTKKSSKKKKKGQSEEAEEPVQESGEETAPGEWSTPVYVHLGDTAYSFLYPAISSDGLTLYFAAISDEGLGGLDIYISRYDSESGKFLLAENLGLPFNSTANDYMFAIDEFNGIGYFATDRRQPEGQVCIYTFIPNQKRITYAGSDYDEETIRSRARIDRISDTWGDGQQRAEAIARLMGNRQQPKTKEKQASFTFIINDDLVYTSPSDFRNADNRERMNKLVTMRKNFLTLGEQLEKSRIYYATKASISERSELRVDILSQEQEYYQLEADIRQMEKTIRHAELQTLKQ